MPTRPVAVALRLCLPLLIAGTVTPAWAQNGSDEPAAAEETQAPAAEQAEGGDDEEGSQETAPSEEAEEQVPSEQLLRDFLHYVRIARFDLARTMGQSLLDRNIAPQEFSKLVETASTPARFTDTIVSAQRNPELREVATALLRAYEGGKLATARNPDQIAANIQLLKGTAQSRNVGARRLVEAGEYAMPQLLEALIQRPDPLLAQDVETVMVEMGRQAVVPLITALPQLEPVAQEAVARVLGNIGYTTAVPALYRLAQTTRVESVRGAAEEAVRRIVGVVNTQVPLADRYVDLAEAYYTETPSLTPFPGEQTQLWWGYDPGAGLLMQAIDTSVYHEAMAMRNAEEALRVDPANGRAVSTWIASNFSREIDSADGAANPAYGEDRRDAMYYAVASGSAPTQRVLARALDDSDTPLARRALEAIERTAGGAALWAGADGGRQPLLEALRYPNRRVQYEAALALGASGPRESFPGSDQVVRILGGAIRDASARYALVVASDPEVSQSLRSGLEAAGYRVLPPAASLADAAQEIADAPGIDVIISEVGADATIRLIDQVQTDARLRATPILALASGRIADDLANRFARDARVRVGRTGMSTEEAVTSAGQLVEASTGGSISEEDAATYKDRALTVLRDLAASGNTVLSVADASGALVTALGQDTGETKRRIAEVLAYVPTRSAQGALFDTAMEASGEERVALLDEVARSAKHFGNMLQPRQVNTLLELAVSGEGEEATAAAALMGALNLPNNDLVPLILGQSTDQASK